jgi:hypothetical protein
MTRVKSKDMIRHKILGKTQHNQITYYDLVRVFAFTLHLASQPLPVYRSLNQYLCVRLGISMITTDIIRMTLNTVDCRTTDQPWFAEHISCDAASEFPFMDAFVGPRICITRRIQAGYVDSYSIAFQRQELPF